MGLKPYDGLAGDIWTIFKAGEEYVVVDSIKRSQKVEQNKDDYAFTIKGLKYIIHNKIMIVTESFQEYNVF